MTASLANFTNEAKFLPICAKVVDVQSVIAAHNCYSGIPTSLRSVSLQRVRMSHKSGSESDAKFVPFWYNWQPIR